MTRPSDRYPDLPPAVIDALTEGRLYEFAQLIIDGSLPEPTDLLPVSIVFIVDGGTAVISTGVKGDLQIPFGCTIQKATLLADATGSVVVDILKSTYSAFPPVTSICASQKPTLSTASKFTNSTLTGWTLNIAKDDVLRFQIDTVAIIKKLTISLEVMKTA